MRSWQLQCPLRSFTRVGAFDAWDAGSPAALSTQAAAWPALAL